MNKVLGCTALASICVALLLAAALLAAPQQQQQAIFQLQTTDGTKYIGALQELTRGGDVRLVAIPSTIKPNAWVTLRRDNIPLPTFPRAAQIVLVQGDRIPLSEKAVVQLTDKGLRFTPAPPLSPRGETLAPPAADVAVLWLGGMEGGDDPAVMLRQLLTTARAKDVVHLRDGDRVEGAIDALDSAKGCVTTTGTRQVTLPWDSIAAVAFRTAVRPPTDPRGQYVHAILENGCRLALTDAQVAKGGTVLTGLTTFQDAVEIPLAKVIALDVRNGPATYLSDLKPVRYEHKPYLGPSWPLALDGGTAGGELRLAGSTHDKGLGMHAECRATYNLAGKYRWFEARVGLDPDHGLRGRVKLRVLVDGKERELGWTKELTARDEPLILRVDVRGGKELMLEVLCADFGDVQAHVNWCDARVVE